MANNTIDLKFVADSAPIVQANKRLDAMGRTLDGLIKKQSAGAISDKQFVKAKKELRRSIDDLFPSWNKAKSAIDKFEKSVRSNSAALISEKEALKKSKEETKAYVQSRKQAEEANRRFNAELKKKEAAVRQESADLERLRQKYDQGHAAMEAYSKELNDLSRAAKLGVISREQLTKATERLNTATKMGTVVSANYGAAAQNTSKRLNQKSMIMQQTGLQVGDLAVQVQSGTGFLLAFGQQATQLIGTFSLLAKTTKTIALFSALGVLVPIATAIAGSFLRMGDSAEKAKDRVSELKNSLSALKDIRSTLMSGPTEMFSRFGAGAKDAKTLLDLRLKVIQAETQAQVSKSGGFLSGGFEGLDRLLKMRETALETYKRKPGPEIIGLEEGQGLEALGDKLKEIEDDFSVTREGAFSLFEALAKVGSAKTIEQQISAGQKLAETLENTKASLDTLSEDQRKAIRDFTRGSLTLVELEKALKDASENTFENEKKKLRAKEAAISLAQQEVQIVTQAESAREAFKSEETSLARKKELLQIERRFGKESIQLREKIQQFNNLDYASGLRELGVRESLVQTLVAQREENQGLANETERLADAAERTEKALSSLRGFGASVSAQLAKVRAEVEALETGQDPSIAGRIASLRARRQAEIKDALESGAGGWEGMELGGSSASDIQKLEAELKKLAALREKLKPKRLSRTATGKDKASSGFLMEGPAEKFLKTKELAAFEKQLELERELLGVNEDRSRVLRKFGLDFAKRNPEIIAGLEEQIRATREISQIGGVVQKSFEDGFTSIVEGSKSVVGAFKDMARLIIKELFKVLVVQRAVGSFAAGGQGGSGILGFIGNAFTLGVGGAMGGAQHSGGKASGGTVMSNQPYLVGEKGPELIVPRNRGHVMNADLTSNAMGGSGKVTQVFNFSLSANGDESVKKIVAQAAPQIADMAQKGVIAARRRGGTMRNTFG